jgi:hypothetical protein
MNNLEKTIDEAIEFWHKAFSKEGQVDMSRNKSCTSKYIVNKLLTKDAEFESALYQIVTEKLEGRS